MTDKDYEHGHHEHGQHEHGQQQHEERERQERERQERERQERQRGRSERPTGTEKQGETGTTTREPQDITNMTPVDHSIPQGTEQTKPGDSDAPSDEKGQP